MASLDSFCIKNTVVADEIYRIHLQGKGKRHARDIKALKKKIGSPRDNTTPSQTRASCPVELTSAQSQWRADPPRPKGAEMWGMKCRHKPYYYQPKISRSSASTALTCKFQLLIPFWRWSLNVTCVDGYLVLVATGLWTKQEYMHHVGTTPRFCTFQVGCFPVSLVVLIGSNPKLPNFSSKCKPPITALTVDLWILSGKLTLFAPTYTGSILHGLWTLLSRRLLSYHVYRSNQILRWFSHLVVVWSTQYGTKEISPLDAKILISYGTMDALCIYKYFEFDEVTSGFSESYSHMWLHWTATELTQRDENYETLIHWCCQS